MPEIEKLTLNDPETQSADIVSGNVAALQALFPEAFSEGRIDFKVLEQLLGGAVDDGEEKYGLNWHGKRRARQISLTPSTGTLLPCPQDSVDWDTTQNLMIEGDNLEVLKLLQKSYSGEIKMIYIDPPYNTGKDFVYPDDFRDGIRNYLELTGQVEGGKRTTSNSEASGRFHTAWLNMIYPRLKLARNLLRDDGVIFISIDDSEQDNVKKLCNEIFGEESFAGVFPWRSRTAKADVPFGVSSDVEWVICYAMAGFVAGRAGERKYHKSSDFEERWRLADLTTNKSKDERANSFFTMVNPRNGDQFPASEVRTWAVTVETFPDYYAKGKIVFPGDYSFLNIKAPAFRVFENEDRDKAMKKYGSDEVRMSISTYLPEKDVGRTEHGSKEVRDLFGSQVFSYPKPTGLLKFFVQNCTFNDDIVLDFFAGSGTTADAVMQVNAADSGKRRFIVVQLPEILDPSVNEQKTAFEFCRVNSLLPRLSEVTKERIRRSAKKVKSENSKFSGDLGFRSYKLASSNIRAWEPVAADLENTLLAHVEHLVPGRTEADILTELLLKLGLDLCVPIEQKQIAGKTVHSIGAGALIACLSDGITRDVAEELGTGIAAWRKALNPAVDTRVVFKDSGFADNDAKLNMAAILTQAGITDMRSL